jgi:hypothetical protein
MPKRELQLFWEKEILNGNYSKGQTAITCIKYLYAYSERPANLPDVCQRFVKWFFAMPVSKKCEETDPASSTPQQECRTGCMFQNFIF